MVIKVIDNCLVDVFIIYGKGMVKVYYVMVLRKFVEIVFGRVSMISYRGLVDLWSLDRVCLVLKILKSESLES